MQCTSRCMLDLIFICSIAFGELVARSSCNAVLMLKILALMCFSIVQAGKKHAEERPSKKQKSGARSSAARAPASAAAQAAALLSDIARPSEP